MCRARKKREKGRFDVLACDGIDGREGELARCLFGGNGCIEDACFAKQGTLTFVYQVTVDHIDDVEEISGSAPVEERVDLAGIDFDRIQTKNGNTPCQERQGQRHWMRREKVRAQRVVDLDCDGVVVSSQVRVAEDP